MSPLDKHITDFLEYLEVERGRANRTIKNYDFYLRRFSRWAGNVAPGKISKDLVRKYRLFLNREVPGREEETIKKNTQNYHLIALRSFLKFLAKRDVVSLASEQIELAKQSNRTVEFLEIEELERILKAPDTHAEGLVGLRDKAILETLFASGMRVSELCSLKIEQVNLNRDEFTVRGKGDKPRVVFLSDASKVALKKYLAARKDAAPYMFVSHDRAKAGRGEVGALTPRSVERLVIYYAKAAGIPKKVTPHTLRHTFATDLLLSGADIRSVQSMLGHASITTTQVYTHITNKTLHDVHKKFHGKSGENT